IRTLICGIRTFIFGIRTLICGIRTFIFGIRTLLIGVRTFLLHMCGLPPVINNYSLNGVNYRIFS
ncbi:MAG: hypothetical protein ACOYN4_14015, partial [Bacteroidales bacterium]